MFDLVDDPTEQNNLLYEGTATLSDEVAKKFEQLKDEIALLKKQYKDEEQFADPATWPKGGSDGPFDDKAPLGPKTVAQAILLSTTMPK